MIIAFEAQHLRQICEDDTVACRELGVEATRILLLRLADIRAATNIFDLPVGRPRIQGDNGELLEFDLGHDLVMTWIVNHIKWPVNETGDVDWNSVTRIRLLRMGGSKCT